MYRNKVLRGWALALAAVWLCGCSESGTESGWTGGAEGAGSVVSVGLGIGGWEGTRASGEMLWPVELLLTKQGDAVVTRRVAVTPGEAQTSVAVPAGNWDVWAVCGLPEGCVQGGLTDALTVPDASAGGKVCFAVGKAGVTVAGGLASPQRLAITAQRQVAWLEVRVEGVPKGVERMSLYVRGLCDGYSVAGGWSASAAAASTYSKVPLELSNEEEGVYEGGCLMAPAAEGSGVAFVAEAVTEGGYASFLAYTSEATMGAGVHLRQTLKFSDLALVEEDISLGDWSVKTDEGVFSAAFPLTTGERYFSYPATVNSVGVTTATVVAHKPLRVKLADVRSWADLKDIPYGLMPGAGVARWAFPTTVGWEALDAQFKAAGCDPIDRSAANVLAFMDKTTGTFYRYDFANAAFTPVNGSSADEFLIYPFGIIKLLQ